MNPERREALRDLIALLGLAITLGPGGAGGAWAALHWLAPLTLGDMRSTLDLGDACLLIIILVLCALIGSFLGGFLWLLLMRPFLTRDEVAKWLTYEIYIPLLTPVSLRILDIIYHNKP